MSFINEEITQPQLNDFYSGYYTEANLAVPGFVRDRLDLTMCRFDPYRKAGRLLDVGFGAGTLLDSAERAGWDCWGTEISTSALTAAEGRSWRLHEGDVADLDLPAASFDVVCMVELLEHVPNPIAQLKAAVRLLRPGGILYGTTPNSRGISARILGTQWSAFAAPEHIQLFGPRSLRHAFQDVGLRPQWLHAHGLNPAEIKAFLRRVGAIKSETRVESAYALNSRLNASSGGRFTRDLLNSALSIGLLGDTLKFVAERTQ